MSDNTDDDLEALVAGMREPFLRTSRERVAIIRTLGLDVPIAADPAPSLARLVREAHTLKGGGAAFGFPSLTQTAARVETAAKAVQTQGSPGAADALGDAILELEAVILQLTAR